MLPFLKRKWPRIAPPPEEKTVNASYHDQMMDHYGHEMMEAISTKNAGQLRRTLEAMASHFEQEEAHASDSRQVPESL